MKQNETEICECGHGRNRHIECGDLMELWCDDCGCYKFTPQPAEGIADRAKEAREFYIQRYGEAATYWGTYDAMAEFATQETSALTKERDELLEALVNLTNGLIGLYAFACSDTAKDGAEIAVKFCEWFCTTFPDHHLRLENYRALKTSGD